MAETILLLTKFAGQFSQDYETTDKFNLFLQTLLDENIDAFTKSVNTDKDLKCVYNGIFHPERVKHVTLPKPKPKPKPQRKNKSIYVTENSPDKLAGDIIGDKFRYRNEGKLFWDGHQAIPLSKEHDENGHVPPIIETCVGNSIQDALYWQETIVYNNMVYACFDKSLVINVTKVSIHDVGTKSSVGFTFDFKGDKWLVITDDVESIYTPKYWNNIRVNQEDYKDIADGLDVKYQHVLIDI
jgi:hypothetical protein